MTRRNGLLHFWRYHRIVSHTAYYLHAAECCSVFWVVVGYCRVFSCALLSVLCMPWCGVTHCYVLLGVVTCCCMLVHATPCCCVLLGVVEFCSLLVRILRVVAYFRVLQQCCRVLIRVVAFYCLLLRAAACLCVLICAITCCCMLLNIAVCYGVLLHFLLHLLCVVGFF